MDAVLTALVEEKIGPGEQSRLLIQVAKEKIAFECGIAFRSPVFALQYALKSLRLEDGAEVVLSGLSPRYYGQVLEDAHLNAVYCDVASFSAVPDPESIEKVRTKKTACIILHHTLGFVPDTAAILGMGLPVIEDCSDSYGSEYPAPATLSIIGLEERDMLTAGGGAILYAHGKREAAVIRHYEYVAPEYALPDMNAAMAVVQIRDHAKNRGKCHDIAARYTQAAMQTRHKRFSGECNDYAFPLIIETGLKEVKNYIKRHEIAVEDAFSGTAVHAGRALPEQCPEAFSLSLRTILFPLYPRLSATDVEKIARVIGTLP
ncbi:aminotransferase [Spirochaetia bacterium]|nr:aminotransferase [Spirochaetia bacterium]